MAKIGFILLSLFILTHSFGYDYSTTLRVHDTGTEVLYPAWPVDLKCGFWQVEPNLILKGQSGYAYAKDKLGTCGSHMHLWYCDRTGKEVIRFYAITGYGEQNQFNYTAVDRFAINYKMKCGDTVLQNDVVKENHPCQIDVYVSYKSQEQL